MRKKRVAPRSKCSSSYNLHSKCRDRIRPTLVGKKISKRKEKKELRGGPFFSLFFLTGERDLKPNTNGVVRTRNYKTLATIILKNEFLGNKFFRFLVFQGCARVIQLPNEEK